MLAPDRNSGGGAPRPTPSAQPGGEHQQPPRRGRVRRSAVAARRVSGTAGVGRRIFISGRGTTRRRIAGTRRPRRLRVGLLLTPRGRAPSVSSSGSSSVCTGSTRHALNVTWPPAHWLPIAAGHAGRTGEPGMPGAGLISMSSTGSTPTGSCVGGSPWTVASVRNTPNCTGAAGGTSSALVHAPTKRTLDTSWKSTARSTRP